jgi:hypothetical protein
MQISVTLLQFVITLLLIGFVVVMLSVISAVIDDTCYLIQLFIVYCYYWYYSDA